MKTNTIPKFLPAVIVIGLAILGGLYLAFTKSRLLKKSKLAQSQLTQSSVNQTPAVTMVSPQEFDELAKDEAVFILDVHTPEQTHIPGTDAFVPFDQLEENLDQLPANKATPILVYCRSGGMSAKASQDLANMGYTQVYDLAGGLNAYRESSNQVTLWPASQDLGTVIFGDVATTTFTLTNLTPLPLKITRISTSCSCTQAEVENKQLSAYSSTLVKVSFDPAVHKDNTDLGDLTRTIYLETDNPNFAELTANITAKVIGDNKSSP
jgi:rhodanese-related sulfurtransferase